MRHRKGTVFEVMQHIRLAWIGNLALNNALLRVGFFDETHDDPKERFENQEIQYGDGISA